jgi:hypothetical protein
MLDDLELAVALVGAEVDITQARRMLAEGSAGAGAALDKAIKDRNAILESEGIDPVEWDEQRTPVIEQFQRLRTQLSTAKTTKETSDE